MSTRERLLEAAARLVARQGAYRLTLDGVAAEAGVSKGGLLYHFPGKEALISAMVAVLLEEFSQALAREEARERGPGAFLRSYIRATFACRPQMANLSALAAALAHDPALMAPVAAGFRRWKDRARHDGLPHERADALRLAVDGLWFTELFGFAPLEEGERRALEAELLGLAREDAP